jgi:hypothetical protein
MITDSTISIRRLACFFQLSPSFSVIIHTTANKLRRPYALHVAKETSFYQEGCPPDMHQMHVLVQSGHILSVQSSQFVELVWILKIRDKILLAVEQVLILIRSI